MNAEKHQEAHKRYFDDLVEKLRLKKESAPREVLSRHEPRTMRKPRRKPGKRPVKDKPSHDE